MILAGQAFTQAEQAMHFRLKFSWLCDPGGEMGGPAASAVALAAEGPTFLRMKARPRAVPSPAATRKKVLL
jgi:hypothetical protein